MTFKRKNGFSWPPDKAQILAWFCIIALGLMGFGTLAVALKEPYNYSLSIVFLIIYLTHIAFNITVMAINPGEEASLKRKITPANDFDRTKHKHVIENQFCNICQIIVSFKAKHCKRCNKCVTHFDHHCIYLNNCIGSRNYKIFICTIVSAFVGVVATFAVGLSAFVVSFTNDTNFLTRYYFIHDQNFCNQNYCSDDYKKFPILFIPAPVNVWRAFVMAICAFTFVAACLIGYLIGYHIFLACSKMTTYEHTIRIKEKETQKSEGYTTKSGCCGCGGGDSSKSPPLPNDQRGKPNPDHQNSSYKAADFSYDRNNADSNKNNKNEVFRNGNLESKSQHYEGILPAIPAVTSSANALPPINTISSSVALEDRRHSNALLNGKLGNLNGNRLTPINQNKYQSANYLDVNYKMTYEPASESQANESQNYSRRSPYSGKTRGENSLEMRQLDQENPLEDGSTRSRNRFTNRSPSPAPAPKPNSRQLPPLTRANIRTNVNLHATDHIDDSNDDAEELQPVSKNRYLKSKRPIDMEDGYDFEYKQKATHSYDISNENLRASNGLSVNLQNETQQTSARVRSERRRRRANPISALPNRASSRTSNPDSDANQSNTSLRTSQRRYDGSKSRAIDENITLSNLNSSVSPKPLNSKPLNQVSTQSFLNGSSSSLEEVDPRSKPGENVRSFPSSHLQASNAGATKYPSAKTNGYMDDEPDDSGRRGSKDKRLNKSYDLGNSNRYGDQSDRAVQSTRSAYNYSKPLHNEDQSSRKSAMSNLRKSSQGSDDELNDEDDDDNVIFNDSKSNNTPILRRT